MEKFIRLFRWLGLVTVILLLTLFPFSLATGIDSNSVKIVGYSGEGESHFTIGSGVGNSNFGIGWSPTWWDEDWEYRNVLSFIASSISENLTDFPVLVKLDSTRIDFDKVKANGADIRFVDEDDTTELKYEIELWDDTGETAAIWIKKPSLIGGEDYTHYIFMYYGNPAADDAQDPTQVWDSHYLMVWHMDDDPDTSHVADSTANSENGTKAAANTPLEITGYISKAQDFDAVVASHFIEASVDRGVGNNSTIEVITKANIAPEGWRVIVRSWADIGGEDYQWLLYDGSLGCYSPAVGQVRTLGLGKSTEGVYRHIAWTIDPAEVVRGFCDGAYGGTNTMWGSGVYLRLWGYRTPFHATSWYDGEMDEVRISDIIRSDEWLEATYLSNSDQLLYYGGEDPPPSVTTLSATGVYSDRSHTHATLNGSLDGLGGSPSCDIWFEWGYDTGYGNTVGSQTVGSTGSYSVAIQDMDAGTTVHFRFAGENVDGTTYGEDEDFYVPYYSESYTGLTPILKASPLIVLVAFLIGGVLMFFLGAKRQNPLFFGIGMALIGVGFILYQVVVNAIDNIL